MRLIAGLLVLAFAAGCSAPKVAGAQPPARTSLTDPAVRYTVQTEPHVALRRGGVEAVVVDNSAVDDGVLPGHRTGYSGVGKLTHERRRENLFVPRYAGLNFEHIHDGTVRERGVLFEPRRATMQLRVIDGHTVELYQPPTPTWRLESCTRYELLADGAIQMTFECIPRARTFNNDYIGLFWASYIHQPRSTDIHFIGRREGEGATPGWVRGVTPEHGVDAVHRATGDDRAFEHDEQFPLRLVFGLSDLRYDEPWYFGVSHGMALALVFRERDGVRLTQSPSGGGRGPSGRRNPAWDFQWFIEDYEIGRAYQMVMRAVYLPYESKEQVREAVEPHRKALRRMR